MSILSAVITLLLVMDPIGNAVNSAVLLQDVHGRRRAYVAFRESLVALAILFAFLFAGRPIMSALQIREPVLSIAGGVVLFLIALRMIFTPEEGIFGTTVEGEPFIVPIATPLLAGPSAMAVVMLLASREPDRLLDWSIALGIVWAVLAVALQAGSLLSQFLGSRGTAAIQKLMGMILTILSIQLFISGVEAYLRL